MPVSNAKACGPFKKAIIEREWDDGYKIIRIRTKDDLTTLSQHGGGCSSHHSFWTDVCKPVCEYFFVLMKPNGEVGPILFCKNVRWFGKKHPQEAEYDKWFREKNNGSFQVTSDLYDKHYNSPEDFQRRAYGSPVASAERNLIRARERYEYCKRRALEYGPLGKDNPYKREVDDANKKIGHCQGVLDQVRLSTTVAPGDVFKYGRVDLCIIQVAGRGVDYDGSNTRYTPKLAEFIGKENNVSA